jgi:ribosomal protein S18 acetylase RimI-like enzyme
VRDDLRLKKDNVRIDITKNIKPEEVIAVREDAKGDVEVWRKCISESLCVVTARDTTNEKLLGIGFLAGNSRHCQIVDLTVHSSARKCGIGRRIVNELLSFAKQHKVRYLGLTYDKKSPWLKDLYEKCGFILIDFAMWEAQSLLD